MAVEDQDAVFDHHKAVDPDFEPPTTTDKAPDLTMAVEGWRAWSVERALPKFGVSPKLHSVTYGGYYWTPRRAAQAHCIRCAVPAGEHCACGFYSARNLEHLLSMGYQTYNEGPEVKVLGKVANWGQITEASYGWRSQFSYPVHLFVPFECHYLCRPLRDGYGVPTTMLNFLKPYEELARIMGEADRNLKTKE